MLDRSFAEIGFEKKVFEGPANLSGIVGASWRALGFIKLTFGLG